MKKPDRQRKGGKKMTAKEFLEETAKRGSLGSKDYMLTEFFEENLSHFRGLWLSSHPLPPLTGRLPGDPRPKEILQVNYLFSETGYEVLYFGEFFPLILGVFPAQVHECLIEWKEDHGTPPFAVYSPVNVPVHRTEKGKLRKFRFVRWARQI